MTGEKMQLRDAMEILRGQRAQGDVMITSMGSAREWIAMAGGEKHLEPLDFVFVPSSMGQAPSLGLGVALAQPDRRVFACNGYGSTLMNLGALVTISAGARRISSSSFSTTASTKSPARSRLRAVRSAALISAASTLPRSPAPADGSRFIGSTISKSGATPRTTRSTHPARYLSSWKSPRFQAPWAQNHPAPPSPGPAPSSKPCADSRCDRRSPDSCWSGAAAR